MISSRRLGREWALKVLYQVDVGKCAPDEALAAALEHLRTDFVHRGSRANGGSRVKETCLDCLTSGLREALPGLRVPLERSLSAVVGTLVQDAHYWQDLRLERALRTRLTASVLKSTSPVSVTESPGADPCGGSGDLSEQTGSLDENDRETLHGFVRSQRELLPVALEPEMRKVALSLAKEWSAATASVGTLELKQAYVREQRSLHFVADRARWLKIAAGARKTIDDWMRASAFVHKLVVGTLAEQATIDERLGALSEGWKMTRQAAVDRNILRLAAYEMLFVAGIPAGASINEAVELAKKYSTADSGRFVNGVLGTLAADLGDKGGPASDGPNTGEHGGAADIEEIEDIDDIEELEDIEDILETDDADRLPDIPDREDSDLL